MSVLIQTTIVGGLFVTYFLNRILRDNVFFPWYTRLFGIGKPRYKVFGECYENFESVKDIFIEHFEKGSEVGSSVVVYSGGKKVVELYGGYQNFGTKEQYDENTLNIVFSSSKTMVAFVIAKLVDEGLLDYNEKVTKYWPEYGNGGKQNIRLCDVLRHEGGLPLFNDPQPSLDTIYDEAKLKKYLENHEHLFNEKITRAYHGVARGWILNQIVKAVDKKSRTIGQIYKEEINPQFDIEFYLGLDQDKVARRAKWYNYPSLDICTLLLPKWMLGDKAVSIDFSIMKKDSYFAKMLKTKLSKDKDFPNSDDILTTEIPSVNGHTNAKTLAKMAAIFANKGQLDGQIFISSSCCEASISDPIVRFDEVIRKDTTFTLGGFGVFTFPEFEGIEGAEFYGWGGMGGSLILFNPKYNFAFSYVMNAQHMVLLGEGKGHRLLTNSFKAHIKNYK